MASGRQGELGGALAEEREKLFSAPALVALEMADDGELACGRTAGEGDVDEIGFIGRIARNLGQDGDADAECDEGLHGGDLGAPEPHARLKVMVAAESLDLTRERAGGAEDDECLAREIGSLQARLPSQRMVLGHDKEKRFGEERHDGEPDVLDGQGHDGEVDLALDRGPGEMGAEILTHIDLQIGVTLPAPGDERGQQIGSDGRDGADGDAAFQGGVIAQFFGGIFDFEQNAAGAFEENFAGLGEDCFATEAVEELSSDFGFQVDYLLAKRWLAYVYALRCAGEIAGFSDGDNVAELVEFHSL